jgi:23S rRNA (uridine2552-2'-O)-methyltransferase
MSKLSDRRSRHDVFHRRARQQGFRARAVFKLEEIDQKLELLRRGDRVLDLGCAPGSWLQYCRTRVGPTGQLVGIDRAPLEADLPGARLLVGDVHEVAADELLGELEAFYVVL